jgi:exonuclease III
MRIVTWNCNLALSRKLDALLALSPDIAVVQECERDLPVPQGYSYHWQGVNPAKGLGVLTRDLAAHTTGQGTDQWAFFIPIALPALRVKLLAAWAFNHRAAKFSPARSGMALPVVESLASWLGEGKSIVAGDFNNNADWDTPRGKNNFSAIDGRLSTLGLTSAYHSASGESHGKESTMTHYFQKNESRGFHIDYCFVHKSLIVESVLLSTYEQWRALSDHVLLLVNVNAA